MFVFGLSLFVFACLFVLGVIRSHFDKQEVARAVRSRHG
jgi:hypothetical protein